MSIIQRGLRSSTRSKAVMAKLRLSAGAEATGFAAPRRGVGRGLPPRPKDMPRPLAPPDLTEDQQAAAEHLAEVFAAAEFETWGRGGPSLENRPCDPLQPSPEALIARAAYRAAMRAVPVLLSPLVVHVCCLGLPLVLWAEQKRVSPAQAEAGLRTALTHLVQHFRALAAS